LLYYGIKPESIGQLGVLARQIIQCVEGSALLKVKFIRPYGVAYLDQFILNLKDRRNSRVASTYPEVNQYLKQCRFKHLPRNAPCGNPFPQQEIITIRRFGGSPLDVENKVVRWLTKEVLILHFLPKLSAKLRKEIVENLWEIIHNGLVHGEGESGVSACGQFYPQMGYFEVAFSDLGHGIPKLVRDFRAVPLSACDADCLAWAVEKGHSTRPFTESAGLGLHLLRQFLSINGGVFQLISGDGYFGQVGPNQPTITTLRNPIQGTLVNIRVVFDDRLYKLKGEDL
jgi:hypothetical protein